MWSELTTSLRSLWLLTLVTYREVFYLHCCSDFTQTTEEQNVQKFVDGTRLLELISNDNETAYRIEVSSLVV